MAITLTESQADPVGWISNGNSADASGAEVLKAAPGAGVQLLVDKLVISSGAAITVTVGSGESASAVETVIWGPVHMAANSQVIWKPERAAQLAANKALVIDASGAGDVTVIAEGRSV